MSPRLSFSSLPIAFMLGCSGAAGSGSGTHADSSSGGSPAVNAGGSGVGGSAQSGGSVGSGGSAQAGSGNASSTGGSTSGGSDGGSAGSGGSTPIPHEVGECDDLGEVGVWEEITPPDGMTGDFALDPAHAGTVYVGGGDGGIGIRKTTDCGSTWEHVSTGPGSEDVEAGGQTTFQIDGVKGTLYTNSLYGHDGVYKSTNGGVDWQNITPSGEGMHSFIGHIDIDPEDGDHLLAMHHAACAGDGDRQGGCFGETTDGGATWKAHYHEPQFPGEVMVFLLHGGTWIAGASEGMLRTTNAGETWTKVSDLGAGGHSTRPPYRASDGAYYAGTSLGGVLRSDPGTEGASWSNAGNMQWLLGATGDGTNVYISGQAGIWTSPESDGTNWELMPNSPTHSDGCSTDPHTFDADHHLLYVSCHTDGFWRVRTQL
jgi:hypothetical protein